MKKILLVLCSVVVALSANAQQQENRDANNKIVRGPYQTNRFFDNVFIQAGAGGSIYIGGQNLGGLGKRVRPVYDIAVGKWITPSIGVRLQYNYSNSMRQYSATHASSYTLCGGRIQQFNFSNLHADFMYNISAAIGGYKESRVYEIIPYVGVGWAHIGRKYTIKQNDISLNVGILNKFRVSKGVDINLELRSSILNGRFDMSCIANKIDVPVAATVGVTIRLGKVKGFKRAAAPANYTPYVERIKSLTHDSTTLSTLMNGLAKEVAELRNRKPETVVVEGVKSVKTSPVALFFPLGKSTLDSKELTNLEFYVKNAMKADKDKTFTIIGSADKATGSKELNQRLSEARMQNVYDLLVNKYGVSKDKLVKKAEGDNNNRFEEPALNRAVIIE